MENVYKKKQAVKHIDSLFFTGLGGFEPPTDGVRVRCLTIWR